MWGPLKFFPPAHGRKMLEKRPNLSYSKNTHICKQEPCPTHSFCVKEGEHPLPLFVPHSPAAAAATSSHYSLPSLLLCTRFVYVFSSSDDLFALPWIPLPSTDIFTLPRFTFFKWKSLLLYVRGPCFHLHYLVLFFFFFFGWKSRIAIVLFLFSIWLLLKNLQSYFVCLLIFA